MKEIERFKGNLNKYLIETNKGSKYSIENGGNTIQHIFKFDNGFGASVIQYSKTGSFKWELALIGFDKDINQKVIDNCSFEKHNFLHLSDKGVSSKLRIIKKLTNFDCSNFELY